MQASCRLRPIDLPRREDSDWHSVELGKESSFLWYRPTERTTERTNGRTDGRTNERTDERTNERTKQHLVVWLTPLSHYLESKPGIIQVIPAGKTADPDSLFEGQGIAQEAEWGRKMRLAAFREWQSISNMVSQATNAQKNLSTYLCPASGEF